MISKKYVIAMAILGGVLFSTTALNTIDLDEQTEAELKKTSVHSDGSPKKML